MNKFTLTLFSFLGFLSANTLFAQNQFITEWVTNDGAITIRTSAAALLVGETSPYTYNYDISWYNKRTGAQLGTEVGVTGNYTITNLPTDTIEVRISGSFPHLYMNGSSIDAPELVNVTDWGNMQWKNFAGSFYGCINLKNLPQQAPDLSQVTSLELTFALCYVLDQDLSSWDVSNITNMVGTFGLAYLFNSDISSWNTSNVTSMYQMFYNAYNFNQDISSWNTSNVTDLSYMLYGANTFNQDISSWNVSNVNTTSYMFYNAYNFNQDLSSWDIFNLTSASYMFSGTAISYCNMDNILNAWGYNIINNFTRIYSIPAASTNSASIRAAIGTSLVATPDNIVSNPISTTFYVDPIPTTIFCLGDEITATANGATTYEWNGVLGNSTQIITASANPIIVKGTDTYGCSITDTLEVLTYPQTPITITTASNIVCNGTSTVLVASGGDAYEWSTGETQSEITVTPTQTTTYTLSNVDSNGCTTTAELEVFVNDLPAVIISADSTTICNGNNITLLASGANTYEWSTQETQPEITVAPTQTTTYTVIGTDANGCQNTTELQITVETCISVDKVDYSYAIYPNPTNDLVNITLENVDYSNASISLIDITGRVLSTTNLVDANTTISLANYPAGLYLIKVQAGNTSFVEKVNKL